jgi:hypothetical protein
LNPQGGTGATPCEPTKAYYDEKLLVSIHVLERERERERERCYYDEKLLVSRQAARILAAHHKQSAVALDVLVYFETDCLWFQVGYRWYDEHQVEPAFPFGHGLSYTTFHYSDLTITPDAAVSPQAICPCLCFMDRV